MSVARKFNVGDRVRHAEKDMSDATVVGYNEYGYVMVHFDAERDEMTQSFENGWYESSFEHIDVPSDFIEDIV